VHAGDALSFAEVLPLLLLLLLLLLLCVHCSAHLKLVWPDCYVEWWRERQPQHRSSAPVQVWNQQLCSISSSSIGASWNAVTC
jgi:hypothetical protein